MDVNGWRLFAHPLFLDQLERLVAAVSLLRHQDPRTCEASPNVKLLAALRKLVFETVPADPSRSEYRQGDTLGAHRKHWFRVKFGGQRFRLFFRYDSKSRVIIYAWVNDSQTLRTYGAKTDAYAVFRGLLDAGDPPDDWASLLQAAAQAEATERLATHGPKPPNPILPDQIPSMEAKRTRKP